MSIIMTVPGLILIPDFLSPTEEEWLIENIKAGKWVKNRNGDRNVQVYGPYHDYKYEIIPGKYSSHPDYLGDLIELMFQRVADQIPLSEKLRDEKLTEVFINEFQPGQTLHQHFDHTRTYEECIIGISCNSDTKMCFTSGSTAKQVLIPRRSLYAMTGKSRYQYKHGIREPVSEKRLSVTFRTVK